MTEPKKTERNEQLDRFAAAALTALPKKPALLPEQKAVIAYNIAWAMMDEGEKVSKGPKKEKK